MMNKTPHHTTPAFSESKALHESSQINLLGLLTLYRGLPFCFESRETTAKHQQFVPQLRWKVLFLVPRGRFKRGSGASWKRGLEISSLLFQPRHSSSRS